MGKEFYNTLLKEREKRRRGGKVKQLQDDLN
jgi:hypothetical protein